MAINQTHAAAKQNDDESKSRLDALLTYANGVTGQADTNIGDAIKTLCDGFGGGVEWGSINNKTRYPITVPCDPSTHILLVLRDDIDTWVTPDNPCKKDTIAGALYISDINTRINNSTTELGCCVYIIANTNHAGYTSTVQRAAGRVTKSESGITINGPDSYFYFDPGEYRYLTL